MMLAHPLLERAIEIKEGEAAVLVIENPIELRKTVMNIKNGDSELVLSEGDNILDIHKYVELFDNLFDIDFASKRILSGINSEAERVAEEYPTETEEVFSALVKFGNFVSNKLETPVKLMFDGDNEKIMKLLSFAVDTDEMSFPEKLLSYMEISEKFFKKKLFVFLNLKSFLSKDELELFYKNISYEGFRVLLLESFSRNFFEKYEKSIIIDEDLCII